MGIAKKLPNKNKCMDLKGTDNTTCFKTYQLLKKLDAQVKFQIDF